MSVNFTPKRKTFLILSVNLTRETLLKRNLDLFAKKTQKIRRTT